MSAGERADAIPEAAIDAVVPLIAAGDERWKRARALEILTAAAPFLRAAQPEAEVRVRVIGSVHDWLAEHFPDAVEPFKAWAVGVRAAHPKADRAPEDEPFLEQRLDPADECVVRFADRAPGEVETAMRALDWIADRAKYLAEPAWNLEGCALVGKQMYERANEARAALDAARGRSREGTVALAEHMRLRASHTDGQTRQTWLEAADVVARFGAGRAEGEA